MSLASFGSGCFTPGPIGGFEEGTGTTNEATSAADGSETTRVDGPDDEGTTAGATPGDGDTEGPDATSTADGATPDTTGGTEDSEGSDGDTAAEESSGSESGGKEPATVCPVFVDAFDDDTEDARWLQPYPESTDEVGGELVITVSAAANDEFARMMVAPETGGMQGATARVEVGDAPTDGVFFILWVNQHVGDGRLAFQIANEGGLSQIQVRLTPEVGSPSITNSTAWDPIGMHWLQVREEAGTFFFEGSADGAVFDTVFSMPTPFDMSEARIGFVGHNSFELAADAQVSARAFEFICADD